MSNEADEAVVLALLPGASRVAVETALGTGVRWCAGAEEFLGALREGPWAVLLLALDRDGVDEALASRVSAECAARQGAGAGTHPPALFLTARETSVERVLAAERAGAVALLAHPPGEETLRSEILPVIEEPGQVAIPETARGGDDVIVGSSPALMEVFRVVARVAATPATVLITGESGTGKELVARALHLQGPRADGPFVAVNCAALPDTLLEAELFGYERGAFTGAVARSDGRFGRADRGTLFLDEVGEMSLSLQAKLLRVLETGEVERLGSRESVRVDARVVAATNRNLPERVAAGQFREDLLFRLTVVEVELPPLRRRREDVGPLALHFAARFARGYGRRVDALSRVAWERLRSYPWPGNIRELRNVMDRAVLLARGGVIRSGDLRLGESAPRTSPVGGRGGLGYAPTLSLREVEARHIRAVLEHTGGHMGDAARVLGIHRNTMTMKVREHGIDVSALAGRPPEGG